MAIAEEVNSGGQEWGQQNDCSQESMLRIGGKRVVDGYCNSTMMCLVRQGEFYIYRL